jgi:hypothetical protein
VRGAVRGAVHRALGVGVVADAVRVRSLAHVAPGQWSWRPWRRYQSASHRAASLRHARGEGSPPYLPPISSLSPPYLLPISSPSPPHLLPISSLPPPYLLPISSRSPPNLLPISSRSPLGAPEEEPLRMSVGFCRAVTRLTLWPLCWSMGTAAWSAGPSPTAAHAA